MLEKSQVKYFDEMLSEMPDSIKMNQRYGMLVSILSEYYVIKLDAEIKSFSKEHMKNIKSKFPGCNGKKEVLETCKTLKNADGHNVFLFEEVSAIEQISNLRNNTCAHTELINSGHITKEQLSVFLGWAQSFIAKFDDYISS